jgi:hypothetical protein
MSQLSPAPSTITVFSACNMRRHHPFGKAKDYPDERMRLSARSRSFPVAPWNSGAAVNNSYEDS